MTEFRRRPASNSVLIFGAGIAGLTAAHELAERGFRVTIWEPRSVLGGKARSIDVPRSATEGRRPLPGEHGFRLFPGFYRHVVDSMCRIPFRHNARGVADNLVSVRQTLFASTNQKPFRFPVHAPKSLDDLVHWSTTLVGATEAWVPAADSAFFAQRMLVLLTSSEQRRERELEHVSWWQFMDASRRSAQYQRYLAGGLTRSLVAMKAEVGSARTLGLILQALAFDNFTPGGSSDRVLNGPTNSVWIDPWVSHLKQMGVRFCRGELRGFELDGKRIGRARVASSRSRERCVDADQFICALPHEVLCRLLTPELLEAAPSLAGISMLQTEWMNGIQYYLDRDVSLNEGHCVFVDSPWALTAISQRQYWRGADLREYGDGRASGIISVDISDWNTPGVLYGRPARHCTATEIAKEVWAQMKMHLNGCGGDVLHDAAVVRWFLDPAIVFDGPRQLRNTEPLLINTVGSWQHRPEAHTDIENLYVAGDYVRTHTDLATMEGANESARRAVNALLARAGAYYSRCAIWPLPEPAVFAPLKLMDARRFNRGLPHAWYDSSINSIQGAISHRIVGLAQSFGTLLARKPDRPEPESSRRATIRADVSSAPPACTT